MKSLRPVSEIEKTSSQECLEKTYASVIEEIEDKVKLGEIFVTFHPKALNTTSIVQRDMWLEIEKKINAVDGYCAKLYLPDAFFMQFVLCVAIKRSKSMMNRISFWNNPHVKMLIFGGVGAILLTLVFLFSLMGFFIVTESAAVRSDRLFNLLGSGLLSIVLYTFVYKHIGWYRDWNKLVFGKK